MGGEMVQQGPGSLGADGAYAHPTLFMLTQLLGQPKIFSKPDVRTYI